MVNGRVATALILLMAMGCVPRSFTDLTTRTHVDVPSPRPDETFSASRGQVNGPVATGGAYLVLSTAQAPYLHRLVRVPVSCLLGISVCAPPQRISSYPEQGVTPSRMYWAPDGRQALLLDTYQPRVLRFDASDASLTTLIDNCPTIQDNLAWLPDGRAAFVIQGPGDYASQLVTLVPEKGRSEIQTLASFDGIATLLGADTTGNLVVSLDVYAVPTGRQSSKKEVVGVRLLVVSPSTARVTELSANVVWLTERPQAMLPDGRHLIYGSGELSLWDLQTGATELLGSAVTHPVGSPDGRMVAVVAEGPSGDTSIVRKVDVETGESYDLAQLPGDQKPFWTTDRRFLILAGTSDVNPSRTSLRVVNLESRAVTESRLDLGAYPIVEDLSFGP